jgi:hypothetical protein
MRQVVADTMRPFLFLTITKVKQDLVWGIDPVTMGAVAGI